jgi:hypothetical protein
MAKLVVDPIPEGGPEIVEQRARMAGFEAGEIGVGLEGGLLNEISGVERVPSPRRHAAVGPSAQPWQIARKQLIERAAVPSPGPSVQVLGRGVNYKRRNLLRRVHERDPPNRVSEPSVQV